jgi:hypothetical protein
MLNISFDFDPVTQKVTNVVVKDTEGKTVKPKTKKSSSIDTSKPLLVVADNKLVLNDPLITMLNVEAGDRITVNYYTVNNQETFPVIGRSDVFADPQSGNKLTKSNTICFRGNQRTILLEYGEEFTIEEFKPGMFKLISQKDCATAIEEKELEDLNPSEIDLEVAQIMSNDNLDDLPF